MAWQEINFREVKENVVKLISDDWALVTAGTPQAHNTMTVSWGGIGELWFKDVSFIFIRPQRHTLGFIEAQSHYSVSFFNPKYKDALKLCGAKSGRDINKDEAAHITADFTQAAPFYEEANLVLICRKMAVQDIQPEGFLDAKIQETYQAKDYHRMFVGEIEKVLIKV